jgi:hypothetical protein
MKHFYGILDAWWTCLWMKTLLQSFGTWTSICEWKPPLDENTFLELGRRLCSTGTIQKMNTEVPLMVINEPTP